MVVCIVSAQLHNLQLDVADATLACQQTPLYCTPLCCIRAENVWQRDFYSGLSESRHTHRAWTIHTLKGRLPLRVGDVHTVPSCDGHFNWEGDCGMIESPDEAKVRAQNLVRYWEEDTRWPRLLRHDRDISIRISSTKTDYSLIKVLPLFVLYFRLEMISNEWWLSLGDSSPGQGTVFSNP